VIQAYVRVLLLISQHTNQRCKERSGLFHKWW